MQFLVNSTFKTVNLSVELNELRHLIFWFIVTPNIDCTLFRVYLNPLKKIRNLIFPLYVWLCRKLQLVVLLFYKSLKHFVILLRLFIKFLMQILNIKYKYNFRFRHMPLISRDDSELGSFFEFSLVQKHLNSFLCLLEISLFIQNYLYIPAKRIHFDNWNVTKSLFHEIPYFFTVFFSIFANQQIFFYYLLHTFYRKITVKYN